MFRAIPYAEPPTGEYRFKPTKIKSPLTEEFDAVDFGKKCIDESKEIRSENSEDCLHLNIYTPKTSLTASRSVGLLPVLVYIHGGQFEYGTCFNLTSYEPGFIIF